MEDRYGMPLFERKSVPPQFSALGRRLLELADAVLPCVSQAERDLARIAHGSTGQMRIVVECHTCFDWLMPAMDTFRERWPQVELDIVSGFHTDPVSLVLQGRAEVAVIGEPDDADPAAAAITCHPLFRYEMLALLSRSHPLAARPFLAPQDFAGETLITYPVPDDMLDVMRQVLTPAGITPRGRRTTELTVAMLQLVASGRGIATLPRWAVQGYLERGYVIAKPITAQGLHAHLHMATAKAASAPWLVDFVSITRECTFTSLPGIELLPWPGCIG